MKVDIPVEGGDGDGGEDKCAKACDCPNDPCDKCWNDCNKCLGIPEDEECVPGDDGSAGPVPGDDGSA